MQLFVSYARENKPDIDQLVEHLGMMGHDTWVDQKLRGGQDWWQEILQRIADSDAFIAIISRGALHSTACGREFDWAEVLAKPVLPVAIEPPPTALPRRYVRRQIIDYSDPKERALAALKLQGGLAALPPVPPLPEPLPEPPAPPLSYLTDLIDLIAQPDFLDYDKQHEILAQLEPALRSTDPEERRGGRDIMDRFSSRRDIFADVDRTITRLRSIDDWDPFGPQGGIPLAPNSGTSPVPPPVSAVPPTDADQRPGMVSPVAEAQGPNADTDPAASKAASTAPECRTAAASPPPANTTVRTQVGPVAAESRAGMKSTPRKLRIPFKLQVVLWLLAGLVGGFLVAEFVYAALHPGKAVPWVIWIGIFLGTCARAIHLIRNRNQARRSARGEGRSPAD